MTKANIIERKIFGGITVAFIKRDSTFNPFIIAYGYQEDGTWMQGHYFESFDSAVRYWVSEYCEPKVTKDGLMGMVDKMTLGEVC